MNTLFASHMNQECDGMCILVLGPRPMILHQSRASQEVVHLCSKVTELLGYVILSLET